MSVVKASLRYLETPEGSRLYYQKWLPARPDAVLVFVHGLTDHVGRYNSFVQYFSSRNIGVCLFDLRGHGNSSGPRKAIRKFHDYMHDIAQFMRFIARDSGTVPLFLVGQSLGGQLVLNYIVRNARGLAGAVVASPLIEIAREISSWRMRFGRLLARLAPSYSVDLKIDPRNLTHDAALVEDYRNDPNVCHKVTLKCGLEILQNAALMMGLACRIHLPLLLMHGESDPLCRAGGTRKFFMGVPARHKELKIYPGLYHELLNEIEKEKVFGDMEKWMRARIAFETPRKGVEYVSPV